MSQINSWTLDVNCLWERDGAEIPFDKRPLDFAEKFDFKTLVYHAFDNGMKIKLICPKLMSLERLYEKTEFFADGEKVSSSLQKFRQFDEISIAINGVNELRLENDCGAKTFSLDDSIDDSIARKFIGLDTIVTVNKNAHFEWIEDFINFHILHHGAEALLFYDNGSTDYSIEEIENLLSSTALKAWAVISVPLPFGPVLLDRSHQYCFLQVALLNIARQSFLRYASAVLSIDIDELVIPGRKSIFDAAKKSMTGMARFAGHWRYCSSTASKTLHHSDHFMKVEKDRKCPHKYCYVPAKLIGRLPFDWHGISMENPIIRKLLHAAVNYSSGGFWHCAGITRHWKGQRLAISDGAIVDTQMLRTIQETWPEPAK
jgi:hypothetical protein